MRLNTCVLLVLAIGCNVEYFKTVGFATDSLGDDDIADIAHSILGNDTVLQSLLQRYPEFYSVVAQIVNQTYSNGTVTAINEAFICNIASSAINDSKDNCLNLKNKTIDSCFEKPNATETANASIFQLCKNSTATLSATSTPTFSKQTTVIADASFASSISTTILHKRSTTEEIITSDKPTTETRDNSTVPATKSSQNEWTNLSSARPTSFPTRVPSTVELLPGSNTMPSTTTVAPDATEPAVAIAPPPPGIAPPIATAPPLIINPPVWIIQQSITDVTSNYLFLAIKLAVKIAMVSFERRCNTRKGIYVTDKRLCIISNTAGHNGTRNYTIVPDPNVNRADVKKLQILHIAGNSASILAMLLLIIEYFSCKSHFSLFDKSILSLALSLLISHLMQLLITFLSWNKTFCKAGGVLLHWALLTSFAWMTVISIDMFRTFRKMRRADSRSNRQYRRYVVFAAAAPTTVILTCVFLGIPDNDYSGYGYQGRCFIGKVWANLFSFILPVAVSMVLNTALMVATLITIYKLKRRSARAFSAGSGQGSSSRKKVVISILTLKLSILFGIGWTIGFVDSIIGTPTMTFIFTGIVSLQGLFIFLCFGCHKGFATKCHRRLFRKVGSPMLQKRIKRTNDTETTYL